MAPKPIYTSSAKQTTTALRAYWPDIYTVPFSQLLLSSQSKIYFRIRFCQVLQILLSIFSSFHLFPSLKYQVFNFTNRNSIGILFLNNFYSFKLILTRKVEKFQKMTLVTSYLYRVNQQCCPGENHPETPWRPPSGGLQGVSGFFG